MLAITTTTFSEPVGSDSLFTSVRRAIQPHIASLVSDWLPNGKRSSKEWVARNPTRDDRHAGSFRINLHTGQWIDFATQDKGGDLISLRAYLQGISQYEAAKDLAQLFGIERAYQRTTAKYLPKAEVKRLSSLVRFLSKQDHDQLNDQGRALFESSRTQLNEYMGDQFAEPVELKDCPSITPPTTYTSTGKRIEWARKQLSQAEDYPQAAALALTLGYALITKVPYHCSLSEVLSLIRANTPPALLHSYTLAQIQQRLEYRLERRKKNALELPTADQLNRHQLSTPSELTALSEHQLEQGGVWIIKAPHGSGKTQGIGQPFTQWASRQTDGRFTALAHRQSLVGELAQRLGCDDYRTVNHLNASGIWKLATCLQSITAENKAQIIRETRYLFIDEIAQVLEAIPAEVSRAGGASKAQLLHTFKSLIQNAKVLIAADAGIDEKTLHFLEQCRPNESFNIISLPSKPTGQANFAHGAEAMGQAIGALTTRLANNERLWISCGERHRAKLLAHMAAQITSRVLLITRETVGEPDVRAFLDDPEVESVRWDCVIHTGVISSGLSIEHRARPYFTHGMLVTSGATITPADALQMMRRVRYLKNWSLFILNNRVRLTDVKSIAFSAYQVLGRHCSEYDLFALNMEQSRKTRQTDFAAGLWWLLEHFGISLTRQAANAEDNNTQQQINSLNQQLKQQRIKAIFAAPDLSPQQAEHLRYQPHTEDQALALLKHRCKTELNRSTLSLADIAAWQEGAAVRQWDRFSAALLNVHDADNIGSDLTLGYYGQQIYTEYQRLFTGIDLYPGVALTTEQCELIQTRMIERRFQLAFLKLIPAKYGRLSLDKHGQLLEFKRPSYPTREVGDLFRLMGLNLKRVEVKSSTDTPVLDKALTETEASVGGITTPKPVRQHRYIVDAQLWAQVRAYAQQRNLIRMIVPLDSPSSIPGLSAPVANKQSSSISVVEPQPSYALLEENTWVAREEEPIDGEFDSDPLADDYWAQYLIEYEGDEWD